MRIETLNTRELQNKNSQIAVINVLLERGPLSRPEIMKTTKLSQTAIHEATKGLIERGVLVETGVGESSGGRRPLLLEVNKNAGYAIGINICKQGITTAVVDLLGTVVASRNDDLPDDPSEKQITDWICNSIHTLLEESGNRSKLANLLGIGIGITGIVDAASGHLLASPILKWKDIHLKANIESKLKIPVFVDNDVNVLLAAEKRYGHWKHKKNILCILIGTGIGGGIILDSKLYRGSNGASAEFGHMVVDPNGPLCRCGKQGCLTTLASDQYLINETQRLLPVTGEGSPLRKVLESQDKSLLLQTIISSVEAGDPVAKRVYDNSLYNLAIGIDNLIRIFDPQLVLVGRESVPTESRLIETLKLHLGNINKLSLYSNVKLMPFSLDKDGWNIGAADLVFKEFVRNF